jgi:predicted nucleic acid-binding protein
VSLVVDSSILVAALVDDGPVGRWAERLIGADPLAAPAMIQAEVTNVLRRMELSGEISPIEAALAHSDLAALDIELFPFQPFSNRIWELRRSVTSYDAWYVAMAEALDLPLATLDRRLARNKDATCAFVTGPE